MKDNFFRLTAIVLLLHCFAATAKIMGQNNGDGFAFAEPITDPHDLPLTETVLSVPADEPPAEKFYAVVRYQKVEPGMMDEYLKMLDSFKKAIQQRKDKGELRYWRVFRRTFPSGVNVKYDYISVTAFDTGEQLEAWEKLATLNSSGGIVRGEYAVPYLNPLLFVKSRMVDSHPVAEIFPEPGDEKPFITFKIAGKSALYV